LAESSPTKEKQTKQKNLINPKIEKKSTVKPVKKKPKILRFRSLEEFENLKLFNSNYGKAKVRIGILGMPVHKNMRKFLQKKGFNGLVKDAIYKQNRVTDRSQAHVSWHKRDGRRIIRALNRRVSKYAYYPTSYAKSLFGWNIFDYLVQKNGDSLVRIIRSLIKINFLKLGETSWSTRFLSVLL
jgi:hypothetical protein